MNDHHTKYTGDVAVAHVVADLVDKRWFVLTPLYSEHLAFDVLAYRVINGAPEYLRVQVKSYKDLSVKTKWYNRTGHVSRTSYTKETIDYFAIWLPKVGRVVYVPIGMFEDAGSLRITDELVPSKTPFYWYEDFLEICPDSRAKRTSKEFGIVIPPPPPRTQTKKLIAYQDRVKLSRKVQLSDEELKSLVWSKPMREAAEQFGISDVGLKKECKRRGIDTPPQGYWIKKGIR